MSTLLSRIEENRVNKRIALEHGGIVCYPERFERSEISDIREQVIKFLPSSMNDLEGVNALGRVSVAGRIMGIRSHRTVIFLDIKGQSGNIQIAIDRKDPPQIHDGRGNIHDNLNIQDIQTDGAAFVEKYIDIGDFVGISGIGFLTLKGEPTIKSHQIQILTKSISPLPEKFHGLTDVETRYRKRYLDILNPEVQALLTRRSKYFSSMRRYFEDKGFLELDTPRLENTTGGADARPFETHYNAYDSEVFLRISAGELWQKRLMAGGFEKTFEIGPVFRNEGVSPEHAQDYMQMEVYWAYADYRDMMVLIKDMYLAVIDGTYGRRKFSIHGHEVDFDNTWETLDYEALIMKKTGIDIFHSTEEEIIAKLQEIGAYYEEGNRPRLVDYLWKNIRKTITGPAFLINEPKFTSPLAKSDIHNSEITHRFHIIIAGSEVGNGYSELNDPIDQLERFENQQKMRDNGDSEAQMADYDFVDMLKHGMPPTAGFGVSERLFAFLEGLPIKECQTFPYVKRK